MAKVALVLSGGGARGAFQVAAEKYAREEKGYAWDLIAGVSAGALNGTMLAMGKYVRLEEIWRTISNDQVYTGSTGPGALIKVFGLSLYSIGRLLLGKPSIYRNTPLQRLIEREYEPDRVRVDLRIGAVSLKTGQYIVFHPRGSTLPAATVERAILASSAIPVLFPPTDVSAEFATMVDGGVRNVSPLGDVLDFDPDEIVIINCEPTALGLAAAPLRNAIDIGRRALEIATNEIFREDLNEFLRINRLVEQARAHKVTLLKEDERPFRFFKHTLIEPVAPLDDVLDFSPRAVGRSMEAGLARAKAVLG